MAKPKTNGPDAKKEKPAVLDLIGALIEAADWRHLRYSPVQSGDRTLGPVSDFVLKVVATRLNAVEKMAMAEAQMPFRRFPHEYAGLSKVMAESELQIDLLTAIFDQAAYEELGVSPVIGAITLRYDGQKIVAVVTEMEQQRIAQKLERVEKRALRKAEQFAGGDPDSVEPDRQELMARLAERVGMDVEDIPPEIREMVGRAAGAIRRHGAHMN